MASGKGKDIYAVWVGTIYLLIYCILLQIESMRAYAMMMFGISPFMLIGMVYIVLKYGKYEGPSLGDKESGYQDKPEDLS